ncbi:MAG: VCBS repeat-containing protein [Deltaproteobacteria bacterium]|nr:VCBS repeat-containing protein [Deltaproteobacteria bacterium]
MAGLDAGPLFAPRSITVSVGPAGGTVAVAGVSLVIPPGALAEPRDITATVTYRAPDGYIARSPVCQYGPAGLTFRVPVIVTIPFAPGSGTPALLWSSASGSGFDTLPSVVVDGAMQASVNHFSYGFVGWESPACSNGDQACIDFTTLGVCVGGIYTSSPCPAGQGCHGGGRCEPFTCTFGTSLCSDGFRLDCRRAGSDFQWSGPFSCPAGQTCPVGGTACVPRVCVPWSRSCVDLATMRECNRDGLSYTLNPCRTSQACLGEGICTNRICLPTTPTTCVDMNTRQACNPDGQGYTPTACPPSTSCAGGVCTPWICTPGSTSCADASTLQTCNASGLARTSTACPVGQTCTAGACVIACPAGLTLCGGVCVDTMTSAANCSRCGNACVAATGGSVSCVAGSCVSACPAGQSNCGGVCQATGASCTTPGTGGCQQTGTVACAATGTATACSATAPRTSGPCASPAGGVCDSTGACVCGAGQSNCGGVCQATGASCTTPGTGGCQQTGTITCAPTGTMTACSATTPRTSGACTSPAGGVCGPLGSCTCRAGQRSCDGACSDPMTDANNCGTCGHVCPVPPSRGAGICFEGRCIITCDEGYGPCGTTCTVGCACPSGQTLCGGTCISTATDPSNCGVCGRVCVAPTGGTVACVGSGCAPACPSGQTFCGSACVSTATDLSNCGLCGRVCVAPTGGSVACVASSCVPACPPGQSNCGGVCRATGASCMSAGTGGCQQTGTIVCASAGTTTVCSVGPRSSGACTSPPGGVCDAVGTCGCGTGMTLCSGRCVDTLTDSANCSTCGRACTSGLVCDGGACAAPVPRALAPLSTAAVTSRRPTLRWILPGGATGARVTLCRNRALTIGCLAAIDAVGTSAAPSAELAAGVWFWALASRSGTVTGTVMSPTWEFTVGARTAAIATSWGTTLDVNGDGYADVVVSAVGSDTAYVYLGGAGGLGVTPRTLTGPTSGSSFGNSVASAGDVNGDGYGDVVVSAVGSGTAYVYLGGAGGLGATPRTLTGPTGTTYFGSNVASAGDVNGDGYADLVLGSDGTSAAYIYLGGAGGPGATPTTVAGPSAVRFGWSVAGAGDLNGDGYADLVVGAYYAGMVYIYLGGAGGLSATATTLTGPTGSSNFGQHLANAGDLNGDGYADLVVGAPGSMLFPPTEGRVYVYLGGASGLGATPTTLSSASPDLSFGRVVAGAGDLNGDGYADLVVGSGDLNAAYFYLGRASGLSTTSTTVTGPRGFGGAAAGAGDVNGDGYADLIVGGTNPTHLYFGRASGLSAPPTILMAPAGAIFFGHSVASLGDLPGDGRSRFWPTRHLFGSLRNTI